MAHLEEGWPLGLQPVNDVRLNGQREYYFGSASFHSLLSGSTSSSTDSSSDLDSESTGSFFHDKSKTLGKLMGVPTAMDLLRRKSLHLRRARVYSPTKSGIRPKTWCFSLCSMDTTDAVHNPKTNTNDYSAPSLGQFLDIERRAGNGHRRRLDPYVIGPDKMGLAQPALNSLFVNRSAAPSSRAIPLTLPRIGKRADDLIMGGEGNREAPLLFSCVCG